jgi:hypothetical protein
MPLAHPDERIKQGNVSLNLTWFDSGASGLSHPMRSPSRHIRHRNDTEDVLQVTPLSFAGQKFRLPLAHVLPVRTMKLRKEHRKANGAGA